MNISCDGGQSRLRRLGVGGFTAARVITKAALFEQMATSGS